ncbi:MAG: hypothetical protein JRC69_05440 [Deltaproteobacteria bacterium]|nr:hypothetical protein [Deltaproteobacteria bacterium]
MKLGLWGAADVNPVHTSRSISTVRSGTDRFFFYVVGLCAGLFLAVNAQAAFQVLEDFDSLTLGDIDEQNGWVATAGSGEVVPGPTDGSSQALKVMTDSGAIRRTASVPQGTTRMLFLRFRFEEHGEFSFGLSHLLNPYEHSDFGPELGMASATASDPKNEFRVANGLTNGIYDVLETLVPGSWYNIWILIDNTADTYQVWMNSVPSGNAQAGDKLTNNVIESLFGFRTPTGKDLINFFIKTGGNKSPVEGRLYIDDIYLEDSDGINLNNPLIPTTHPTKCLPWLLLLLRAEDS